VFPRRITVTQQIPFDLTSGHIDVVAMMSIALPLFDKIKMLDAIRSSHKLTYVHDYHNRIIGYLVPKETNYVMELIGILRSWLPIDYYTVMTEANVEEKFADIHIKYSIREFAQKLKSSQFSLVSQKIFAFPKRACAFPNFVSNFFFSTMKLLHRDLQKLIEYQEFNGNYLNSLFRRSIRL